MSGPKKTNTDENTQKISLLDNPMMPIIVQSITPIMGGVIGALVGVIAVPELRQPDAVVETTEETEKPSSDA